MKFWTHIAYCQDQRKKNLGKELNDFMAIIPDGDWAVFLDHDAMFLHDQWGAVLKDSIEVNPEYKLMTCYTNRVGNPHQVDPHFAWSCDDVKKARSRAKERMEKESGVSKLSDSIPMSGHFLAISKEAWKEVPFRDGLLGIDNHIHRDFRNKGYNVGIVNKLMVYHWYRGGDRANKTHLA